MADRLKEAQDLMMQADKRKGQSGGLFGFMKDSSEKFEDASDLYRQAAGKFKLAKEWKDAGDAYCKSAECQTKCKAPHESCKDLADASVCYKKINSPLAVEMLERASQICIDMGRHGQAAKHCQSIAEHYEATDPEKSMQYYQQAADYFDSEDSSGSSANKCRLKVAHLSAQLEQYEKAAELFEAAAQGMINNHLLKFSAKEFYLKAGLCRMASGDSIGAAQAAVNYTNEFPAFKDTREEKLLNNLLQAAGEADADEYTKVVQEYDAISRLDNWMTSILLKIKKGLTSDDIL